MYLRAGSFPGESCRPDVSVQDICRANSHQSDGKIFAETFGLEGVCYPYVGDHLFGDGSHRRLFRAGLEEEYRIYDFSSARELPDHLGIILQFLAKDEDEEGTDELISLSLIPALRRMLEGFDRTTPYREVLPALLLVLQEGRTIRNQKMIPEMEQESLSGQ